MVEEFKAEMVDGHLVVKPIIIKKINDNGGTDITIRVPTLPIIKAKIEEYG